MILIYFNYYLTSVNDKLTQYKDFKTYFRVCFEIAQVIKSSDSFDKS